jgi:hypothetical protein
MGYYVQINKSTVVIKRDDLPQVYQIWKAMNAPEFNHLKNGGSWSSGKETAKWYSWMGENYDSTSDSALDILELLGFDYSVNENNNISIDYYNNKMGQENLFFVAIAHLLEDSFIRWVGEDGDIFEWKFENGKMYSDGRLQDNPFLPVVNANLIENKGE